MPSTTELAERLARRVSDRGASVAVAESLTSGTIASALGASEGSSEWFRGGVIAYAPEVKFDVLGVEPGPVVTREAAETMAHGVAKLCGADLGLAVTGVGGPAREGDIEPGTVFIAAVYDGTVVSQQRRFPGGMDRVLEATVGAALELGLRALDN
ncbi:nicotinamide-nucleotide amidase [Microbacteriaceae bacterium SG_E_30_P1]|uniref:Nicotinamide-nucleotide amidase n=1 Tax=Antiquaquibacter oligotrophicus TaxID=2880260 RepID=A0ABT6KRK0_9MICO|nr:CinA family protein [Antiquaquibacter oligotrophicus]MDH6182593.1 nicotinamide-nucleotide amidase [Antiquaquibacter oligotrophicus]UDF14442.1 CinA family protein [Antiquaquibacter oligotrophicus]